MSVTIAYPFEVNDTLRHNQTSERRTITKIRKGALDITLIDWRNEARKGTSTLRCWLAWASDASFIPVRPRRRV